MERVTFCLSKVALSAIAGDSVNSSLNLSQQAKYFPYNLFDIFFSPWIHQDKFCWTTDKGSCNSVDSFPRPNVKVFPQN